MRFAHRVAGQVGGWAVVAVVTGVATVMLTFAWLMAPFVDRYDPTPPGWQPTPTMTAR